jgi:hypothetical protein
MDAGRISGLGGGDTAKARSHRSADLIGCTDSSDLEFLFLRGEQATVCLISQYA